MLRGRSVLSERSVLVCEAGTLRRAQAAREEGNVAAIFSLTFCSDLASFSMVPISSVSTPWYATSARWRSSVSCSSVARLSISECFMVCPGRRAHSCFERFSLNWDSSRRMPRAASRAYARGVGEIGERSR